MRVKNVANFQSFLQLHPGTFQSYAHPKYGFVVTKWPRKRGPKKTPAQQQSVDNFTQAIEWAKTPLAADIEAATLCTSGSGFYIRDAIESACFGNIVIARMRDGTVMYGARMIGQSGQALLDQVTATPGSLLYRGAGGWYGLDPATDDGYILTWSEADAQPEWQPAPSPSSGDLRDYDGTPIPSGSIDVQSYATKGNLFQLEAAIQVQQFWGYLEIATSGTYKWTLAEASGLTGSPTIGTIVATGTFTYSGSAYYRWINVLLSSSVTLSAGQPYCMLLTRTDASGTTAIGVFPGPGQPGAPRIPGYMPNRVLLASNSPAVGNTLSTTGGTNAQYAVGFTWNYPPP